MNRIHLYRNSLAEARRQNELALWRASYRANIACKEAIEQAIRTGFDGMHLESGCLQPVLEEWGFKRTAWVLANTIREKDWDGRFSPVNHQWANRIFVPADPAHNCAFVVESHPAVLDGFVTTYRQAYQELGLFGPAQCEPDSFSSLDYSGKVLVLSPDTLKEEYWSPENMLWYAHDGFGCSPRAIGRSIRCTCLGDGEMTRWNRTDFIGILQDKFLPDWARDKLAAFQDPEQEQSATPHLGGMTIQ